MAIVQHLQEISDEDRAKALLPLIKETVDGWGSTDSFDTRASSRDFAARTIMRTFFDLPKFNPHEFAIALDRIIDRMTNNIVKRPPSKEEAANYEQALVDMRVCIDIIIQESTSDTSILTSKNFSDVEKRSLIFVLFFAGLDTTGTLLNFLLWKLGKEENLCAQFRSLSSPDEEIRFIKNIVKEGLRMHSPAPIQGRYPREPLAINMTHENRTTSHYVVRPPEGLLYVPEIEAFNPKFFSRPNQFNPSRYPDENRAFDKIAFFGGGPHLCPGRNLALFEIEQLLLYLLQNYNPNTLSPDTLSFSSLMVRKAVSAQVSLTSLTNAS